MNEEATQKLIDKARSIGDEEYLLLQNEHLKGRQFGSQLAEERESQCWARDFYEKDKEVFIVVGTGSWNYHYELASLINQHQNLFILDWKLPLLARAYRKGMEPAGDRIAYLFCEDVNQLLFTLVGIFSRYLTRSIKFGFIPPYVHLFADETAQIEKELHRFLTVNAVRSRTIELFGMEWTTNHYLNLNRMLNDGLPFKNLENGFKGVPAVVVSAGPSLEKNIHLLEGIKDRAVIIAAGSSIETLMKKHGIIPHFLTSFDAGAGNYPHFQDLDTEKLRLIFTGDLYPRILNEFKGVLIPAEASNKPTYDLYKSYGAPELGAALVGASVANFALDVAVRMGCEPIVFIGQDLALLNGQSHAEGNYYRSEIEDLSQYIKVKGNVEEYVLTNPSWLTMLANFEAQIANYGGGTFINATEGGAFIKGTIIKTLQEAIDEYMLTTRGVENRIMQLLDKPLDSSISAEKIKDQLMSDVKHTRQIVDETLPKIEDLLERIKAGKKLTSRDQKTIKMIKGREDQLVGSLVYLHIVKTIIFGRILYFDRYYTMKAAEQPDKVELWVAEYQKVLFESSAKALDAFCEDIEQPKETARDSDTMTSEV